MAITIAKADHHGKQPSAPTADLFLDVTLDNSYPAGGYAFDARAEFRAKGGYDKEPVVPFVVAQRKAGFDVEYVDSATPANRKLKILQPNGTEVVNGTDLSASPGVMRVKLEAQ